MDTDFADAGQPLVNLRSVSLSPRTRRRSQSLRACPCLRVPTCPSALPVLTTERGDRVLARALAKRLLPGAIGRGSYVEIAETAVVSIAASASDSEMRPPRISVLAA